MIELVGCALVCSVSAFTLRELGSKSAPVFAVFCALIIFASASELATDTLGGAIGILNSEFTDFGKCVMKLLGIGYIGSITEGVCRELSSPAVAAGVSYFTRAEMLAVVAPYFFEIVDLSRELLL